MKRKITIILLIAIVAIIGVSTIYAATQNETTNKTTLSIKADKPVSVSEMVNSIQVQPYYKNYNHTTLNWLKGFGSDYVVYKTNEYHILMNSTDSNKIVKFITTGVSVNSTIKCDVLENKSLGNNINNILYVENVEVISQDLNNMAFGQK